MFEQSRKGFTLIELLVVIAIVGILSAIVLASLSGARDKSRDAAIVSNLKTVQTQAEVYFYTVGKGQQYNSDGGAGPVGTSGLCYSEMTNTVFKDPKVWAAILQAAELTGGSMSFGSVSNTRCANAFWGKSYAVAALSSSDPTTWFCVDSSGNAVRTITMPSATEAPNLGGGTEGAAACPS